MHIPGINALLKKNYRGVNLIRFLITDCSLQGSFVWKNFPLTLQILDNDFNMYSWLKI